MVAAALTDNSARWRALIVLTLARVSMGLQFQAVASVSPFLARDLALDHTQVGLLIGMFSLPGVVIALLAGAIASRFADRQITLAGLLLLALGGTLVAAAGNYETALAGRVLTGAGGIVLNIQMAKMVTDWFAGREIVLAMAVLINAWPIGIALGQSLIGPLAEMTSWRWALLAGSAASVGGLLLVAGAYRDAPGAAMRQAGLGFAHLTRREMELVCWAAGPWAIYNAAFILVVAFLPAFFLDSGLSMATAGSISGLNTFLFILSVQAGGILVHRWHRAGAIVAVGIFGWTVSLTLLSMGVSPMTLLVTGGLCGGLAAPIFISLPTEVLRPETRGAGMALFYALFYAITATAPFLAGALRDLSHLPSAPITLAVVCALAAWPLYAGFRWRQHH
jgi:predicted MFS family arabinose efflux permease